MDSLLGIKLAYAHMSSQEMEENGYKGKSTIERHKDGLDMNVTGWKGRSECKVKGERRASSHLPHSCRNLAWLPPS